MSADNTPTVPDTEAVREALAWFRPPLGDARLDALADRQGSLKTRWHAVTIVRAALARDVPAGRDLTASDVRDALGAGFMPQTPDQVADRLNRIARPAARPAGDDTAETRTEWRVLALLHETGEVVPVTIDPDMSQARAEDRAQNCRNAGFSRVRVESRTVTTTRTVTPWEAQR